jgi:hypothetical protein
MHVSQVGPWPYKAPAPVADASVMTLLQLYYALSFSEPSPYAAALL